MTPLDKLRNRLETYQFAPTSRKEADRMLPWANDPSCVAHAAAVLSQLPPPEPIPLMRNRSHAIERQYLTCLLALSDLPEAATALEHAITTLSAETDERQWIYARTLALFPDRPTATTVAATLVGFLDSFEPDEVARLADLIGLATPPYLWGLEFHAREAGALCLKLDWYAGPTP